MAATVAAGVQAALESAYAATNATLAVGHADRVTVYDAVIPGVPTNRYAVLYIQPEALRNTTVDGVSRDAQATFQVTFAATAPDLASSPAGRARWLAYKGVSALVDSPLSVDGLAGPVHLECVLVNPPTAVEVVPDRVTIEIVALFSFLADRII